MTNTATATQAASYFRLQELQAELCRALNVQAYGLASAIRDDIASVKESLGHLG